MWHEGCRTTSENIRSRINVPMEQRLELKKSRDQGRDLVPSGLPPLMHSALYYKRATTHTRELGLYVMPHCVHATPRRHATADIWKVPQLRVPLRVAATQAIIHCFPHIHTREKELENIQLRGERGRLPINQRVT